ncbi:MAG: hypothetical protein KDK34_09170, partial [Leptospiraceae bacterium]|nr:hypothetical protein [Leptospiraceae bacterium]
ADILRNREALPPAILAEYDLMEARIRAELGIVGDRTEGQIQADLEMKWNARIAAMLAGGEIDAETAETMRALNMAERTYQTGTQEATFVRYVDRLLHEDRITPGDAAAILDDPSKLHDYNLGSDAPYTEQSRQGFWNKAVGFVQDQWDTLMGGFSSDYGYIDPVSGEFVGRTCFVAGTKVRVHPGTAGALLIDNAYYKDIETIQVGDRVLSWNEDSAEVTYKPVTQTFIRETTLIYHVAYADGTELQTTWNHPFYIDNKGWVEGKDLRVDDHSLTETVFASAAAQHMNANSGTVVAQDKQYKAYNNATATDTRRGLRIVEITKEWRDETVYNFEVADNHTYFVGSGNVLVHNENYSLHSFLTKPAIVTIATRTGTQFKDATGIGESGTLPVGVNIEILSTDPVMVDGELMIPIRTDSGRMGYIPFNEGGPVSSYPSPGSTGNVDTGESGNSPQPELDLNNSQNTDTINNGSNDSDVPTNPTEQLDNCDVNGKVNGQCNPTKPGGLHYDIEVPSWSNLFGFFSGDSADNRTELANSSSTATTEGAEFEANMAYGRGADSSATIESREVNLESEAGGWGAGIGNFF